MARNHLRQPHQFIGGFRLGNDIGRHHTPSSSRSACARASSVIAAPDSILAISSRLSASPRANTPVRVTVPRSEEHTSELQSLMRISYAVFCLIKKKINTRRL